jgi:hypothetical protein
MEVVRPPGNCITAEAGEVKTIENAPSLPVMPGRM